ncbi:hypothetical protein O181_034784 [Austropuccinia psidii MF-1]|uniref:Uncharacterized protein n=1 Tax=Austropuccinia psidii MF-1 TaxID=1389203 RepID=A0A9Q3H9W3_9BASI|nr:hypothetical protein [Austropuccinia psidii MF-1]
MSHLQCKLFGINIPWDQQKQFHWCTCHVLNLVAKDFLLYMGQLTNEDYEFFDDYLTIERVLFDESDNELAPKDVQASINAVKKSSGKLPKKYSCALNQDTLETQDKSGNLSLIMGTNGHDQVDHDVDKLGPVIRPPGEQCEPVVGS